MMCETSRSFKIVAWSLMVSIAAVLVCRILFSTRLTSPNRSDALARRMGFKDAQDNQRLKAWTKSLDQWRLSDRQMAEAKDLYAAGGLTTREVVVSMAGIIGLHDQRHLDPQIVSFLASCTRDPDKAVRMLAMNKISQINTPQAKAAMMAANQEAPTDAPAATRH